MVESRGLRCAEFHPSLDDTEPCIFKRYHSKTTTLNPNPESPHLQVQNRIPEALDPLDTLREPVREVRKEALHEP